MPTSIESRSVSIGELLTNDNTRYAVPPFQRDYSWTEEEVGELIEDIIAAIDEKRDEHFMGAIVVDNSKKPDKLIDGQQRIATISILMCVIRDLSRLMGDDELYSAISQRYLGTLNLRTRTIEPKLTLNKTNDDFYKENLLEPKNLDHIKKLSRKRSLDKSNVALAKAYILLYEKLKKRIEKIGDFQEALLQLEECIREKCVLILILVNDEANAYLIFETLNDRGLDLSVSDLLKNYLFSRAGDKLDEVQRKWDEINQNIGKFELTKFMRHFWLSRKGIVREKELYKALRDSIRTQSEVIDFVNTIRDSTETYGAFEDPQSIVWDIQDEKCRNDLSLLNLFNVNLCYSTLLAAKEVLSEELFSRVVNMVTIISFRYNLICNFSSSLEEVYSHTALFIREKKPKSPKPIFEKLSRLYPDDKTFERNFAKKTFAKSKSKLARYIISEICNFSVKSQEMVINPDSRKLNLEHILPQKPDERWKANFHKSDERKYIYRLGNMALLESSLNRKIGNLDFQQKCQQAYSHSEIGLTKEIANCSNWGPSEIEERQRRMASVACKIWRLNY